MKMKKKATVFIASIMAFCGINTAHADEGMWTIYNLPNAVYEMMQREGFSMTYDQLYNGENALKNAVVNFSGYCSGVVVSPDGFSATAIISVHRWYLKIAVLRWKRFYLIRRLPGDFLWQSRKMRPKRR